MSELLETIYAMISGVHRNTAIKAKPTIKDSIIYPNTKEDKK